MRLLDGIETEGVRLRKDALGKLHRKLKCDREYHSTLLARTLCYILESNEVSLETIKKVSKFVINTKGIAGWRDADSFNVKFLDEPARRILIRSAPPGNATHSYDFLGFLIEMAKTSTSSEEMWEIKWLNYEDTDDVLVANPHCPKDLMSRIQADAEFWLHIRTAQKIL